MEQIILKKTKKVLQHAYETVPFYMELCRKQKIEYGLFESWKDIPIVEKEDLVLQNDSFISVQYLPIYLQGKLLYTHTSGSTGKCANVYWGLADCRRSLLPLWVKRKKYYNINPHDKYCYFFTARNIGQTDVETENRGFALGFCKSNLNDEKLITIWKTMKAFGPIWLNLQPSMAMLLCRVVEKYKLGAIPTLRYVETTGEMLFPYMRQYIKDVLNVTIADQYGCNELNSLAFECPNGQLHVMEKNAVIEILDGKGNSVSDGHEGDLCVTTLTNYAMPLIRYRLGDRGRFSTKKCTCGNTGKILELTTGRSNDLVIDRDGNLLNAYIFARCVENVNKVEEHAVLQFQVIQHSIDDFTINLVLDDDCEPDTICNYFIENLWQSSLIGANFRIQLHSELFPEPQSGKLKWFINEMDIEEMTNNG